MILWVALAIPGYALVRRLIPEEMKSGFFGVLAVSYLGTFTLLAPISILCYLLRAPVMAISVAMVALIVMGAGYLSWRRGWGALVKSVRPVLVLPLLIIAVNMVMSARSGSLLTGDTRTHVSRVRFIVDHGITNEEPYVGKGYFFPPYHTNLLHAVLAGIVRLTGADALSVWFVSRAWALLVTFCGMYYLGFALFDKQWIAAAAALFYLAAQAPVPFLIYPNKIAPFWLLPMMGAFAVEVFRSGFSWRTPAKLAAGSFVLGQVHGLYAIFAGVLVAPALVVVLAARLRSRPRESKLVMACLLALLGGAPFVLIAKFSMNRAGAPEASWIERDETVVHRYYHFDNGWKMLQPGDPSRYQLLALGVLCGLASDRRKQAAVVIAGVGAAATIAFVPPVCTLALKVFGPPHTVYRLLGLIQTVTFVLAPGAVAYLAAAFFKRWWQQTLAGAVVFFGGMNLATGSNDSWRAYWASATADRATRHRALNDLQKRAAFFEEHIPRGAVVLTHERTAMDLVMLHDCHVVIHLRLTQGITDAAQREEDYAALVAPETPQDVRKQLLKKYDVEYFLVDGYLQSTWQWARPYMGEYWQIPGYLLIKLKLD